MEMVMPLLQMAIGISTQAAAGMAAMGGGMGASRRLQFGGWGGASSCPLDPVKEAAATDDATLQEYEDLADQIVPWMRIQIQNCGCANLMVFVSSTLPDTTCMCQSKVSNCTSYKNLMTNLDDLKLGKEAVLLGLPFLVDQMSMFSGGFGRVLGEDTDALAGLRLRAAEEEQARL
jgi:hypothetical protein